MLTLSISFLIYFLEYYKKKYFLEHMETQDAPLYWIRTPMELIKANMHGSWQKVKKFTFNMQNEHEIKDGNNRGQQLKMDFNFQFLWEIEFSFITLVFFLSFSLVCLGQYQYITMVFLLFIFHWNNENIKLHLLYSDIRVKENTSKVTGIH